MAHSSKINGIAKRINALVASKARCLLLNALSKIGQLFQPEAFTTAIYLLNRLPSSFFKYDCPLAVWFRDIQLQQRDLYTWLGPSSTFGCRVYAKIPDKKCVKSQETALVGGREGYFIDYTSESIYRGYFPDSRRIDTVQDQEFDEGYSYKEMRTKVEEESIFSFPK